MDYVHHVHQLYPFYQDRATKKLARTSCWYVPGRIVRMSSAILGQMEDLLGISRCVIAALDIFYTSKLPVKALAASIIPPSQ